MRPRKKKRKREPNDLYSQLALTRPLTSSQRSETCKHPYKVPTPIPPIPPPQPTSTQESRISHLDRQSSPRRWRSAAIPGTKQYQAFDVLRQRPTNRDARRLDELNPDGYPICLLVPRVVTYIQSRRDSMRTVIRTAEQHTGRAEYRACRVCTALPGQAAGWLLGVQAFECTC